MTADLESQLDGLKAQVRAAYDSDHYAAVVELLPIYLGHRPTDSFAWFMYGDSLRLLKRYSDALAALASAQREAPPQEQWRISSVLAELYKSTGKLDRAEELYQQLVTDRDCENKTWCWILRGANLLKLERVAEAESCFRRAATAEGDVDEAYYNLAVALLFQQRYDEALTAVGKAIELDPGFKKGPELRAHIEAAREASLEWLSWDAGK